MKMEDTKPMKLKSKLGRPQSVSPPSALSALMDEIEREKTEEEERRTSRIQLFIRRHGNKRHGMNPAADQCLTKALSQEPPKVWQDFIARLGQFNSGDIQECINEANYLRSGEYPWQVALTKINPTWKNIIVTASGFELWKVCSVILDEFRVPHEDNEIDDCLVPVPEQENGFISYISTLASGKEPEENDDHNNSEFSASPPEDNMFHDSGLTFAASPTESDSKRKLQLDFNGLPLDQKPSLYSAVEIERCPTEGNRQSPSHLNVSPPLCKVAKDEWNQSDVWKAPPTYQGVSEAVTNKIFYREEVEVPDTARPYNNPFLQNPNAASDGATAITNAQVATAAPQMMIYSPQYSLPYWPMQGPNSPMVCVPVMCPSLPASPSTASYGNPVNSIGNGQSYTMVPACIAPTMQMLYGGNATGSQYSMASIGASQPSAVNEAPMEPSRTITASRTPTVIASTNPFANELYAQNSPSPANCYSLPVNYNNMSNGTAERTHESPVTLSSNDNSETNVVSAGPNARHCSSGAVSLPNMTQNKMTVFLTHSADAEEDAKRLKMMLRRRIQGIRIITHDVLDGSPNFTTPEKIDRIFHSVDYIIPIISRQYLEDVKVEVASTNPNAGAIRSLYVKCLNNFYYDGSKNLKVRAWRLTTVPYAEIKKLPSCMTTALGKPEKLVDVLQHCFESRMNAIGNAQG